ncbi:MAG: signal peptide peptidase SppA [Acidobacteria bacterium]|nr:signal peptide peptidase SppA [Acidobacteriota bacterium]
MVKFLLGLATGVLVVFATLFLLFLSLMRFREKPPEIADNTVLVMRLSGDVPEKPPMELPDFLSSGPTPVTVTAVWRSLEAAAADPRIKAVVVEPEGIASGWAKLEEIRMDLDKFRKSGKPVFAYLRQPGSREYYLASGADRIYLGPSEPVMVKGLRAEMMYFKKTLDKLGVTVDVEHAGKYKDFGDMFTRTDMSPETREVMNSMVDGLYANLVDGIAAGRRKSAADVRAIIDQGPFTASQALKAGLVDALMFEDQMWGEIKDRLKVEPRKVSLANYVRVPPSGTKAQIAIVVGEGDIVRGDPGDDGIGESSLTSYGFTRMLKTLENDSLVKGVIVRIDSPGGEVTASDEIWREMNLLSKKKPMVISMSDAAASGGYFMAMTGDPIVAYPGTLTGSIGVVFGKPILRGLYDKLGVTKDSIQRGQNAGIDSDYTPLSPAQRQKLIDGIDESYRDFVGKVAAARHRKFDEIEPVAQGRVWLGEQAKERGLVDRVGGLDAALALVKEKAKIPAADKVGILLYPAKRSLLEMLTQRKQEDMIEMKAREVMGNVPFHAWMRGGYLRILPLAVDFK